MNRVNKNLTELFEAQEIKTVSEIITHFESQYSKLEEVLQLDKVPEHLIGLEKELAFLKILSYSDLYSIMNIGYYAACNNGNPVEFLDAFFTYSRLNFQRIKLLASGTDHCNYFPSVVEHFAMNDFDKAKDIFRLELGISKNGHKYAKCVTTLIISILHKDTNLIDKAVTIADRYLQGKNSNFDKSTIEFLLASINNDYEKIQTSFKEICKNYKNAKWIHDFKNPLLKEIGIYPIGLFKLAEYFLGIEKNKLTIPETDILWKEFIHLKVRGNNYISFDGKLKQLNKYLD